MAPKISKPNAEIDYNNPMDNKSINATEKGKEATYGKKPVYSGTNPSKDFGSESVHDVDYHKG